MGVISRGVSTARVSTRVGRLVSTGRNISVSGSSGDGRSIVPSKSLRRSGVSTDYERVKRWRSANRERYNQKMRELRARKRGDVKADR
jgi:hypothetical protein